MSIDPTKLEKMLTSARTHIEAGGVGAAEVYYRMIAKDTENPRTGLERVAHGEACIFFARKELHKGRHGAACDWYMRAISADPRCAEYRTEYVIRACLPMAMFKSARIEAERATRIDPLSKDAWRTLGGVEAILGNVEASIAAYDAQLALDCNDANARLDRATIALDTADYGTVRKMVDPVLQTERRADALHVLAMVHNRESNHERAIELYAEAIEAGCYDPSLARWNRSLSLHSIGRYKEGWAEHEYRGKQKTDAAMALVMNRFQRPMWNGEPAPARIHVHQEMGHGDVLAMARYLPLLAMRGYDVRFEVIDGMVDLLKTSMPRITVMPKALDYPSALGIPDFDFHIPMLSLPYLFETNIDSVPWQGAYIKADKKQIEAVRGKMGHGLKVGLCWSSGIRTDGIWIAEYGRRKSMRFDRLMPIIQKLPDVEFYSLQVGPERGENAGQINDLLPKKPTWSDTAAVIHHLDLVITVDTSVSHLAGAMGKAVWVMMQKDGSSWHWMCERPGASWNERSPWYPTARLFRQREFNRPHYWDDVLADVLEAMQFAMRPMVRARA